MNRTLLTFVFLTTAVNASADPFRDAYPVCFEAYPDESSQEHKTCIEIAARTPGDWSKQDMEAAVREQLDKQQRAAAAEQQLEANREAASQKLGAMRSDPSAIEFKGIALGMDEATIKNTARFSCRDPHSPVADEVCTLNLGESETIAGVPVNVMSLFFYSEKLEALAITFDESGFSKVTEALLQKYGAASDVKTELVQNRMGASFENKTYTWRRGSASIVARRYASRLNRSNVTYRTDHSLEEFTRRRKSSTKRNAKDL